MVEVAKQEYKYSSRVKADFYDVFLFFVLHRNMDLQEDHNIGLNSNKVRQTTVGLEKNIGFNIDKVSE